MKNRPDRPLDAASSATDAPIPPAEFSADELCQLAAIERRTLRFYIDRGLVAPPVGNTRSARYGPRHLEQLITIRRWRDAGVSLERIAQLLQTGEEGGLPAARPRAGTVSVRSHVHLGEGIELVIDPEQARLSPEQVRALAAAVAAQIARIKEEHHDGDSRQLCGRH